MYYHPRVFRLSLCEFFFVSWCVVDNRCFWYCVESVIVCHEGTDALDEVIDLYADVPQDGAACPSSHDKDYFRVHFGQIEFHGKS